MLVVILLSLFTLCLAGKSINECPELSDDIPPPKNAHDLHPSHIGVVASIGDSITAGVAAKNIETQFVTKSDFKEYRGLSWLSGGDDEATSIANYVRHYSTDLFGSSHGVRELRLCDDTFFCLDYTHEPNTDHLNAAIPSAVSNSIEEQVNYIVEQLGAEPGHANEWKLVNLFMGTNDLSVSCNPQYGFLNYKKNMQNGLALLKQKMDKVIVNIVGLAHTEDIPGLTDKVPDKEISTLEYRRHFENSTLDPQKYECLCCHVPILGKYLISLHVDIFNDILQDIARSYGPGGSFGSDTFTVVYQPFNVDMSSLSPYAISNLDGYHPNVLSYNFFSKMLWKQMFLPKNEKLKKLKYEDEPEMFCPDTTSRIRTD